MTLAQRIINIMDFRDVVNAILDDGLIVTTNGGYQVMSNKHGVPEYDIDEIHRRLRAEIDLSVSCLLEATVEMFESDGSTRRPLPDAPDGGGDVSDT